MTLQVGVKAFLKNPEGKYLLLKRSPAKYGKTDGSWDIVGGRIDAGSTLLENLRREIKEETRLDLTSEPKLVFAQDILRGNDKHVVRLSYVADISGDPILDLEENVEYKWLSLLEMKGMPDLDIYVKEILEQGILAEELAAQSSL
ncbi:MAG: 8-oxo-dGTP diphosphatase [Candidatus Parcubacteria bacterium]|jgi:ADP-ribose pyrophosphatase YjhB (NUDIX family)|nr:8-oxo-dGTP diphosphatase [Candidatus Parcubacteria bacterium]